MTQFSQDPAVQFRRLVELAQQAVGENVGDADKIYAQVIMEDNHKELASPAMRCFVHAAGGLVSAVRRVLAELEAKRSPRASAITVESFDAFNPPGQDEPAHKQAVREIIRARCEAKLRS